MKTFALLSALAALGLVNASPTATTKQPPTKRANFEAVTASGNGMCTLLLVYFSQVQSHSALLQTDD
jgi:hypothetical protein